jgi:outer membrane protein assembly factor BamB
MNRRTLLSGFAGAALARSLPAATPIDWPQWRGPRRDGLSTEKGLLPQWPTAGPKRLWQATGLGEGYGSVALAGDRIYVQGRKGNDSVVFALNRSGEAPVWTTALGPRLDQDRGPGPRATPTVEGDVLYALSENGDLSCIQLKDGGTSWKKNILKHFGGSNPHWNISESPLIDGDRLIVTPGGPDATVVALDKKTGKTVWTSKGLSDPAGYASCIVADIQGVRTIMTLTAQAGVGLRASDGKLMWREPSPANRVANCTTPILDGNRVFYTSAYSTGCTMLELTAKNNVVTAEKIYFNREMQNHHGGVVVVNGHVYGFSNAILTCMKLENGEVVWKDRSVGKGSLTYADGKLFLLGEGHVAGLAEASPAGYKELGRFPIEDKGLPSWAHPVVCDGKLYIRNQDLLTCYNVKA